MQCKCKEAMKLLFAWDDGEKNAYNLYGCERCGRVCKENVWENKGVIWIDIDEREDLCT